MDVVVGIVGVVGAVVLVLLVAGGRAAREGRGVGHQLLVAPRGARFGDASRAVLDAARAQEEQAQFLRRHENLPEHGDAHAA
ncbi:hypothetical protein [Kineococcus rhizosphaerae]|uniref:Uncharacterized protein n=1 Tax=Kineococcus rhizosphaerae TaxID=559628 RepID=A0A2T0QWV3_9ACTN|nr:hypothetical protein [Kineococcus rhizosphaerae]PRY10053.1 hypothetical protein CLV37_11823 [Kineococcus rhizosphaerae]